MRKFTSTLPTSSGWHSGIRSGVRLAAWMPATRATASTSPLLMAPRATSDVVSGRMCTRPRTTARRCVASFGVTSTIRALPSGSRWVSPRSDMGSTLLLPAGTTRRRGGSAPDLAHAAAGAHELHLADHVPRPLAGDAALDGGRKLVVGGPAPQQLPQVDLVDREEARPQLAVGGRGDRFPRAAERPRHRRDDAHLAPTVEVGEALGGLVAPADRPARVEHLDGRQDLLLANDGVRPPGLVGVERHPLDEAHDDAPLPPERRQGDDLVVVDAPHHDGVDLHGVEPRLLGGGDAVEQVVELVGARRLDEAVAPQRVERDVDPPQPGGDQVAGHRPQRTAVGGERQVDPERRQLADQHRQGRPDGGLPAGGPDAVDAEPLDAHPGNPLDLLEREDLVAGQPDHPLFGHAVGAAEVAAIGDRDPKITMHPAVAVHQRFDQRLDQRFGHARPLTMHPRLDPVSNFYVHSWVGGSSSSMTSTRSPSRTPSPSGRTTNALARAIAPSWCDPWPPAARTCRTPRSAAATTRTKWTLPSGWRGNASSAVAVNRGRC